MYLPALNRRELWPKTACWSALDDLFQLADRSGARLCLAMTAEEVATEIARKELRSYKQLPQVWFEIQTKFRDEQRSGAGLLRLREFMMMDSHSFDVDTAGLDRSYRRHHDAYCRIFNRCGLRYGVVEAHPGERGGSAAHQFVVLTSAAEDLIARCQACGYAANLETARSNIGPTEDLSPEEDGEPLLVHTPGVKTIMDLATFLNVSPKNLMKTVAYVAQEKASQSTASGQTPVIAFIRGDQQLNEAKLSAAIGGRPLRPMEPEEILEVFGAPAGFLGPMGLNIAATDAGAFGSGVIVLVDRALKGRTNLICGANREDYHVRNITPGKSFQPTTYADLRAVGAGEECQRCGHRLQLENAFPIGKILKHGTRCSEATGVQVLGREGKELVPRMGTYTLRMERLLAAAVEQNHDEDGFWLCSEIAPFGVIVTPISVRDEVAMATAIRLGDELEAAGLDVILDDRDERPGVKFKDADLVGIPYRVTVGKKVTEGTIEVLDRSTRETRDARITAIGEYMRELLRPGRSG